MRLRDHANQQSETQEAIGRGLEPCSHCLGWGIDLDRAQPSLAMPAFNAYIAAMYPCPECN